MTTITPSPIPDRRRRAGFTLVEIMIGSTIGAFILAGILSTFLFMGRSGANVQNYTDMETQARKALELFAEDTRQASAITWVTGNQMRLTVNGQYCTYTYADGASVNTGTLTRVITVVSTGATVSRMTLLTGIINPVARTSDTQTSCTPFFRGYNLNGVEFKAIQYAAPSAADLTAASSGTKQLQISMEASRTSQTVASATNTVLSARFILRNKLVTA